MIDRKEAIIKSLVKDIEEAEEQYQMAIRSHLENEDRLIGEQMFGGYYDRNNEWHPLDVSKIVVFVLFLLQKGYVHLLYLKFQMLWFDVK